MRLLVFLPLALACCSTAKYVELPLVPFVPDDATSRRPSRKTLQVRSDGQLFLNRDRTTLSAAFRGGGNELCISADRHAVWEHFQWCAATSAENGKLVWAEVRDSVQKRVFLVPIRAHPGLVADITVARPSPEFLTIVEIHPPDEESPYTVYSTRGVRRAGSDTLLQALSELRVGAARSIVAIEPHKRARVQDCMLAYSLIRKVGVSRVEWGMRTPHPWIRKLTRLPKPRPNGIVARWVITDLELPWLLQMSLPVMPKGPPQSYRRADLVLQVDCGGRVHVDGVVLTRSALDALVANVNSSPAKSGVRSGWSQSSVLMRVDKETHWGKLQDVMRVLRERRFYRVRYATNLVADLSWSTKEACLLDVPRVDLPPEPADTPAKQIAVPFRSGQSSPDPVRVHLSVTNDYVTARLGNRSVHGIKALRSAWSARAPHQRTHIEISADSNVAFKWALRVAGTALELGLTVFFQVE